MTWTGRGKLCGYLTSHREKVGLSGEDRAPPTPHHPTTTLSDRMTKSRRSGSLHRFQDTKEMAAISRTKGEQRLFSCGADASRDECWTEGDSPSCGILMVCSCHTLISQVVHEAL